MRHATFFSIFASCIFLAVTACATRTLEPMVEVAEKSERLELAGTWSYHYTASTKEFPLLFKVDNTAGLWMEYAETGVMRNGEDGNYETMGTATIRILGGPAPIVMQFDIEQSGIWNLDGGRLFMTPHEAAAEPVNNHAVNFIEQFEMPLLLAPGGVILVYTVFENRGEGIELETLSPLSGIEVNISRVTAEQGAEAGRAAVQ